MTWALVTYKHGLVFEGWLTPAEIRELKLHGTLGGVKAKLITIKEKDYAKRADFILC